MEWGGRPLSPAAARAHPRPALPIAAMPFITAIQDLGSDRMPTQGGLSGIPFTAKLAYATHFGYNVDEFLDIISPVDDFYVTNFNSNLKQKAENNGSSSNSTSRS